MEHEIQDYTQELLEKLGFAVEVEAAAQDESVMVTIAGKDVAAIIGRYGETLHSLSHILTLVATQKAGEFTRVVVDADNWRKSREEKLESMTKNAISRVKETGRDYELPPMNPAERRFIHMIISEDDSVASESIGEGNNRRIVIKAKD